MKKRSHFFSGRTPSATEFLWRPIVCIGARNWSGSKQCLFITTWWQIATQFKRQIKGLNSKVLPGNEDAKADLWTWEKLIQAATPTVKK